MSISTERERLLLARNTIRTKMVSWGIAESTDNLTALAQKLNAYNPVMNAGYPTRIYVDSPPTKTEYDEGESLDLSGMSVKADWSDGRTTEITSDCTYTISTGTSLTTADTEIGIKWVWTVLNVEYSTSFEITVNATSFDPTGLSWANSSWEDIAAALEAHKAGQINIYDYMSVGDTRSVQLSAMAATGVGETHIAQTVEIVLTDKDVYDLADGSGKCIFTWDLKNCLSNGTTMEGGYMNQSGTNSGGWEGSARRTWCNNVFYNALPASLKALMPQVKVKASAGSQTSTTITSNDYCFLRSEIEVLNTTAFSFGGEGSQIEYYKEAENRIKKAGANAAGWWMRSPYRYGTPSFALITYTGVASAQNATKNNVGLAPCGCI